MALPTTRMEFRITLSHVERNRELAETVIVGRHPSETADHLMLRVLSFCLLHEDGIAFGPGLSDPDAADLLTHDLTGRLITWIECGNAHLEKLRKVQNHNPGVTVHAVFSDPRRQAELLAEAEGGKRPAPKRGTPPIALWLVDPALVAALSASDERRHRWTVTIVGDHLYLDTGGTSLDGAVTRSTL